MPKDDQPQRTPVPERVGGIKYEHVGAEYLKKRKLSRKAGWVLLWGLGVGAVISGDYFGWNFGLAAGGFWGLAVATVFMALMYTTMMYSLAELSTALPHAGGPYSFARQAFGPWGGYLTGLAVVIEYVITPAVIVAGIGGYLHFVFPAIPLLVWWVLSYAVFVGINIRGVELTLKVSLALTIVAASILLVFYISAIASGAWRWDLLFNLDPAPGNSSSLPFGWIGMFAAIPYAIWFYLAIEELPLAAEETENVSQDMPKAMVLGIFTLLILSVFTLVLNAGVNGGAAGIGKSDAPLADGFAAVFGFGAASAILTLIALTGLIASFHSIIYAYGRQIFALSRAGYFPHVWSLTLPGRHTPYIALIGGALVGLAAVILLDRYSSGIVGAALLNMAVFGAAISYVLMMASYIVIKKRMPKLERPYLSPGGRSFAYIAGILALIAIVACFANPEYRPGVYGIVIWYLAGIIYFWIHGRRHLVAESPEEEFALIKAAEKDLEH
ncbi:MAG: ethanolamine permease [Planctomycetota bacterium]|jgi:ethanolamine permease